MLAGSGYVAAWGNQPRLLTISREELRLEPLAPGQRQPAEIIPLGNIVAYTYWLRVLRFRIFTQYHLRLELADGRVPPCPHGPAGTVRLDVLAKRLARRTKTGPRRRPLFYQTQTARVLLGGSWAALATGLGLR